MVVGSWHPAALDILFKLGRQVARGGLRQMRAILLFSDMLNSSSLCLSMWWNMAIRLGEVGGRRMH